MQLYRVTLNSNGILTEPVLNLHVLDPCRARALQGTFWLAASCPDPWWFGYLPIGYLLDAEIWAAKASSPTSTPTAMPA